MIDDYFGAGYEFIGRGGAGFAYDPAAPLGARNLFWIPSWVDVEVEVDCETGRVVVKHLVVGADSGTSVNAQACRGQVKGAALQAFGQSLFEELRYDGSEPANATPLAYRVPLAGDLPQCFESFVLEHGGPGPFGAKGIGESGMLGVAAAIANAIENAVGVRLTQIPFTQNGCSRPSRVRDDAYRQPADVQSAGDAARQRQVLGGVARAADGGRPGRGSRDTAFRSGAGAGTHRPRSAVFAGLRLSSRNDFFRPGRATWHPVL